jgi:hypothetical protein
MWDTHLAGNKRQAAKRPRAGLPHLESLRALTAHIPLRPLDMSQAQHFHSSPANDLLSARSSAKTDAAPNTARDTFDRKSAPAALIPSPTAILQPSAVMPQLSLHLSINKVASGSATPRVSPPSSSVLPVPSGLPPLPHGCLSLAQPVSLSSTTSLQPPLFPKSSLPESVASQSNLQSDGAMRQSTNPLPASLSLPRSSHSRVLSVGSVQGSDFSREQPPSAVTLCKFRVIPGGGMDGAVLFVALQQPYQIGDSSFVHLFAVSLFLSVGLVCRLPCGPRKPQP